MPPHIVEADHENQIFTLSNGTRWQYSPSDATTASAWAEGHLVRFEGRGSTRVMVNLSFSDRATVIRV